MTTLATTDTGRRLTAAILALSDRADPAEADALRFLRFLARRALRGEDVADAASPVLDDLARR